MLFSSCGFAPFGFEFCRDADWFASVEPSYVAKVVEFEKRGEPFEWYDAMPVSAAAQLFHEQHKFPEALSYYRKAIAAAMRAVMPEHHRARVLKWLETQMNLCEDAQKRGCIPPPEGHFASAAETSVQRED